MPALTHSAILLAGLATTLASQDELWPRDPRPQFANTGSEPDQAPRLEGVTHILVSLSPPDAHLGPPWSITESDAIRDLVTFVERHSLWQSALARGSARFAGPIVYADVYRGTARLATLTYRGPVELGLEAKYANLYQALSPPAVDTLVTLLRIPIRVVPVPPLDTAAGPPSSPRTATAPQNWLLQLAGATSMVATATEPLEVQNQPRAFARF